MAIVKRLVKGSALTHSELDGNFTDLDTRVTTLENTNSDSQTLTLSGTDLIISNGNTVDLSSLSGGGGGSYGDTDVDTHLNTSTATNNQVLSWDGADYAWVSNTGGAEADTLDTVTSRGSTTTNGITVGTFTTSTASAPILTIEGTLTGTSDTPRDLGKIVFKGQSASSNSVEVAQILSRSVNTGASNLTGEIAIVVDTAQNESAYFDDQGLYPGADTTDGTYRALGGNGAKRWTGVHTNGLNITKENGAGVGKLTFGGSTYNSNNTILEPTDPTQVNTIVIPDASGTMALTSDITSYSDTDVATFLNGNLDTSIIPDTNATYDIGSAEKKVRHLYLSDNSLKFTDTTDPLNIVEYSVGRTGTDITFNGSVLKSTSSTDATPGVAVDLTKTNHFVTTGENYTVQDGTYVGQELHFWINSDANPGTTSFTIAIMAQVKYWQNGTFIQGPNLAWQPDYSNNAHHHMIWDGTHWVLNGTQSTV